MVRLRRLPFLCESVVRNFLNRHEVTVGLPTGCLCSYPSFFQRAMFRSAASAQWCFSNRVLNDFSPSGLLWSMRCIHATGAYRSAERDYYDILGISKDATTQEIKKAFQTLAKKYHPDANKNDVYAKKKFQEIRDAYETLRDPDKKSQYDKMRDHSGWHQGAKHSTKNWDGIRFERGTQFSDSFHEIFSEIFENGAESMATDIHVELVLSFAEAAEGCAKHLSCEADLPCDSCYGRGHSLDAKVNRCPICQGSGRVVVSPFITTCSTCRGSGRIIKEYCLACKGSGISRGIRDVKVSIPPGMDSGDTIRVQNAGNFAGLGMPSGDLIIELKVAEDPIFSRQGADIYVNSCISFTQAILGGTVEVPTLGGKSILKIPKGVQHGQLVLLRGKGLPKSGFLVNRGDQYVRFSINLPLSVTERQRAILHEFEETIGESSSSGGNWWQDSIQHASRSKFVFEFSVLLLVLLILFRVLNQ